jgi:cytochrome b6-f complex iron-sulfur subunit
MLRPMQSRRFFLRVIAAGGASAGVCSLGFGCSSPPSATLDAPVDAGNVSALPVGTLRAVTGESVAIGRDTGGVYALSTICTHAGCDIATSGTISSSGLDCGCHGSRFDANGAVLNGPATTPLPHFEVTIDTSGDITIETTEVDPSTRVAVS